MAGMTSKTGEFDPGTSGTGEKYIVSLVLPGMAQSIKAGTAGGSISATFRYFRALKDVSGANIKTIGSYAFQNCGSLTSVNFPAVTSIGSLAFRDCTSLTTAVFPLITYIGEQTFGWCTSLTTVRFPAATSIDYQAFTNCTGLAAITAEDFPLVTSIGNQAFSECRNLTTASFPAVTSIGSTAFSGYVSLNTVSFPQVTSIGGEAFGYTGDGALTITLGEMAPTLGSGMFIAVQLTKNVTVRVPSSVSSSYNTTAWQEAFRGAGNNGDTGTVNTYINLTIQGY